MRRTSQHAEHVFAAMCADRGAVCNKSTEDETGWDHLVEFPAAAAQALPADMRPGGASCLVQVKSTKLGRASTRVKLSNALRFANSPLPCFVVLFVYARNGDPHGIYVAHFWRDLIARTLEVARRMAAEGQEGFHRRHLPIAFAAADRSDDPVSWMLEAIGTPGAYGGRKAAILSQVGFETGLGDASIAFGDGVTVEQVVDAQLGLGGPLDVSRLTFRTRRFGIEAGPALADFEFGTLRIEARPAGTCVASFSPLAGGDEIDVTSEVYVPSQPDLGPERLKVRIVSTIFDLTTKPHTGETAFHMPISPDRRLPVPDVAKLLGLRAMLGAGPVECHVRKDDDVVLSGSISTRRFDDHPGWGAVAAFVSHVAAGVPAERLPTGSAVSLVDLQGRLAEIADFQALTGGDPLRASGEATGDGLAVGSACIVLHAARVEFEQCTFCTVVRRDGTVTAAGGGRLDLILGPPARLRTMIPTGSSASRSGLIGTELSRLAEVVARGAAVPVLVLPDPALPPRTGDALATAPRSVPDLGSGPPSRLDDADPPSSGEAIRAT